MNPDCRENDAREAVGEFDILDGVPEVGRDRDDAGYSRSDGAIDNLVEFRCELSEGKMAVGIN